MKTILVATDFSEASRNASIYAAQLASAFNARLLLFGAYQHIAVPVTEAPVLLASEYVRKITQQLLEQEKASLSTAYEIDIEISCNEGPAADMILITAREKKADLIIAGMKDYGIGLRKLLGSTVTALARKTKIPLIVIPANATYTPISSIALAIESDLETDANNHLLDALKEIGEKFHSKLYLIKVVNNRWNQAYQFSNRPLKLTKLISTLNPLYECVEGNDIISALNQFIKGYRIDMLAMLPHKHSLMDTWFIKSTTRSMVFKTQVPLLILPDPQGEAIQEEPTPGYNVVLPYWGI